MEQFSWNVVVVEQHEPVGLHHVGGNLREKPVWPDTNGAAQQRARLARDLRFDFLGERQRPLGLGKVAGEFALQFVDRLHFFHRDAGFDDGLQLAVIADVNLGTCLDDDDAGTKPAGLGDADIAIEAEFFRLDTDGDAAGRLGHHRHDADGLAAQLRALLLLDGGEVGVEIDGERAEHGPILGGEKPLSNGVSFRQRCP